MAKANPASNLVARKTIAKLSLEKKTVEEDCVARQDVNSTRMDWYLDLVLDLREVLIRAIEEAKRLETVNSRVTSLSTCIEEASAVDLAFPDR